MEPPIHSWSSRLLNPYCGRSLKTSRSSRIRHPPGCRLAGAGNSWGYSQMDRCASWRPKCPPSRCKRTSRGLEGRSCLASGMSHAAGSRDRRQIMTSGRAGEERTIQYCARCGQKLMLSATMASGRAKCPACQAPVIVTGMTATAPEDIPELLPADPLPDNITATRPGQRQRRLDDNDEDRRRPPAELKRKPPLLLWIGLGTLVTGLLVVGIIFLSNMISQQNAQDHSVDN